VRDVNVGERPTTDDGAERYANLKAELYWALRLRLADGDLAGLTDGALIAQLAGLRYDHDGRGRVRVESKVDARRRGLKSPDRAEALMLAFSPADPRAARAALYGLRSG
jgi:phage terminase large subunit